ncbi:MAG TPA: Gfo/Idh/MocA family oxidoreductase, partial [Phycisphaerae bacterium]|nr:Gfo/Idh/MocA family oxidoreductase [Phycisphaerae bacterium]
MGETITPRELGLPEAIPMPTRTDWRIGIIGLGSISGAHIAAYQAAGWRIVAAADLIPERRERAREQLPEAVLYDDYPDLIADDAVEVISLLTHPTLREPVLAAAAKAGKPLLTEKPLGAALPECERMGAMAAEANIPFAVSQNYRWNPANFFARHVIEGGWIGSPFFASIGIHGTQDEQLADNAFYSTCEDFLTVQWNTHLADLLRYWTGRDPRRVFCRTGRMDGQNFRSDNLLVSVVDFGEGLTGHILHSELLRSSMTASPCRVDGDAG